MTMTNEQLTDTIKEHAETITDHADLLNTMFPKVKEMLNSLEDRLKATFDGLETRVGPIVDMKLPDNMKKLTALHDGLQLEVNAASARWSAMHTASTTIGDKVQEAERLYTKAANDIEGIKLVQDGRHQSIQHQLSTISAMTTTGQSGTGGGGGKPMEPIVTHRIMTKVEKLIGNETHQQIDEWFDNNATNIDIIRPGAFKILTEMAKLEKPINNEELEKRDDAVFVLALSRELYVF